MPEQLSSENHVAFVKAEGFAQGWLWTSTDSRELPHCRDPVGMEVLILASFHQPTHILGFILHICWPSNCSSSTHCAITWGLYKTEPHEELN